MDDSPAQLALTAYSRGLWERMADETRAVYERALRPRDAVTADPAGTGRPPGNG